MEMHISTYNAHYFLTTYDKIALTGYKSQTDLYQVRMGGFGHHLPNLVYIYIYGGGNTKSYGGYSIKGIGNCKLCLAVNLLQGNQWRCVFS